MTIIVGPSTKAIAGGGKISATGGIDAHIHYICPRQIAEALMSDVTCMLWAAAIRRTPSRFAATRTPFRLSPSRRDPILECGEHQTALLGRFDQPSADRRVARPPLAAAVLVGMAVSMLSESPLRTGMKVLTALDGSSRPYPPVQIGLMKRSDISP